MSRYFVLFLLFPVAFPQNIDWPMELENLLTKFMEDFNEGRIEDAVHDTFSEDFTAVNILGPSSLEGDFKALAERYRKIYEDGGRFGESEMSVVSSCENDAVTLHRYTIYKGTEIYQTGTTILLLEYANGEVRAKLSQATNQSSSP